MRRALLLIGSIVALAACGVSHRLERRAGAVVEAQQETAIACEAAGACALASPFAALVETTVREATLAAPVHFVTLLEAGEPALAVRMHLMRAARRSIDMQTYIFSEDDAGVLVLNEMLAAARRGVRVRVLLDQPFSLDNVRLLARLARAHANFELKLYNPTFDEANTAPLEAVASLLCCFKRVNQRMHNKTMVFDGTIGITGGRNVDELYFDWSDAYSYRDRDVLVVGPETHAMQASFDEYWDNPTAVAMSGLRDVAMRIVAERDGAEPAAAVRLKRPERIMRIGAQADDLDYIAREFVAKAFRVGRVEYFADRPNNKAARRGRADEDLTRRIGDLLRSAEQRLVLQTPYLILSRQARATLIAQRAAHPELRIIVSTNSLAATDAFFVYAISHKYKRLYMRRLGLEIYEYKPFPGRDQPGLAASDHPSPAARAVVGSRGPRISRRAPAPLTRAGVRHGMHSKSLVVDGRIALIGSHNFDPRSDDLNTEAGLIVWDEPFAQALEALILADTAPSNSWTIAKRQDIPVVTRINRTFARVSEELPIFDLWPFRYAASYELKPGCEPLPASHPRFYECYESVGEFPEVNLSLKQIYTRMIMAFGAGLAPVF